MSEIFSQKKAPCIIRGSGCRDHGLLAAAASHRNGSFPGTGRGRVAAFRQRSAIASVGGINARSKFMKVSMTPFFSIFPIALVLSMISACSASDVDSQAPKTIVVSSEFKPQGEFRRSIIAQTFGEYSNFDKNCSTHAPLIGAINYPRKLEYLGEGSIAAKLVIHGDRKGCPLRLIGIHIALVSDSSEKIAWAAAFYNERHVSGEELFFCYTSIDGPGYCLLKSEKSEDQRRRNRERLIGTVNIKWH